MKQSDLTPGTVTTLGALRPGDVGEFIPESEGFVVQEAWPSGKVVVQYDDDHGAAPYLPTRKVRYLGRGRIEPPRIVMEGEPDRIAELEAGLTWADAKPTVPGAYWVKDGGEEVVTIFEIEGELRVYVPGVRHSISLDEFCRRVGNRTLQFAGPIPAPREKPCTT